MQPTFTFTRRAALLAGASVLAPVASRAAAANDVDAVLQRVFQPLLAEHDIPGLAVGVTQAGQRHVACFGVTARQSGQPVTPDTLFELGSLSKTFTATLGGLALGKGRIALDAHPSRYLPALRGAPIDAATLLHLGTYTAGGLPLQFPDSVTPEGMVAYFRDWKPAAAPGRVRRYSNPSIGLFGHLAALASGRDFADLMQSEVFAGLGLGNSYLRVPDEAMARYAWGHDKAGRAIRVNPGVLDAQAYGVKSSVADMLRFLEVNLDASSLPPLLRQAVATTHVGYFRAGPLVQGLGWEQYDASADLDRLLAGNAATMALDAHEASAITPPLPAPAAAWFNKTGSTNGFGAYAVFVPSRRTGLVLLANRNFPNEARVRAAHAVLQALT